MPMLLLGSSRAAALSRRAAAVGRGGGRLGLLGGHRRDGTAFDCRRPVASTVAAAAGGSELASALSDQGLLRRELFINGEWQRGAASLPVTDPATGREVASVVSGGGKEAEAAIQAAEAARASWAALTGRERGAYLTRWAEGLTATQDDIARIMTAESGKPLAESRAEYSLGVASVHWFAEEAARIHGELLPRVADQKRFVTMRQPVGVVAAITPWNFPMSMITRKVAPALAAGCTVVLKPAELTPLTALAMAEVADRAGLPHGVFNVVMGDAKAIGETMLASETVRKIGFTGSTAVGKMLMAGAANTVKKVSLELGGNAPFIVFDDADLDKAATAALGSAFRNAGQTCICANRVLVQDGVYDEFAQLLASKVAALQLGRGAAPGVTCGPLITPAARDKVREHVEDALARGATALVGGAPAELSDEDCSGGNFFQPTVLRDATPEMRCYREETFGPVAPLFRFAEEADAVAMANDTEYGLAAYAYTRDVGRSWRVAEALEYGLVGINEIGITSEVAPFGGWKMSGLGREQSIHGLDEFLEMKSVCFGL